MRLVPLAHADSSDDLSNRAERVIIGAIGLVLPVALILLAAWRPEHPEERWKLLESISAYYYTGATAAFVGTLGSLALFLFAYQGYHNRWHALDIRAARLAGAAAIGVAFFPTEAPAGYHAAVWWSPWIGIVHYTSATVLFSSFAFFALYLFRRTDPADPSRANRSRDKERRDAVYLVCGLAIAASIVWIAVIALFNHRNAGGVHDRPIFWQECSALFFFSLSWLVKGRAPDVVWRLIKPTHAAPATSG
ncbi:MAG: hypothetical protein ACREPM_09020 [Gemmatimonadaceae bacterium]